MVFLVGFLFWGVHKSISSWATAAQCSSPSRLSVLVRVVSQNLIFGQRWSGLVLLVEFPYLGGLAKFYLWQIMAMHGFSAQFFSFEWSYKHKFLGNGGHT